MADEVRFLSKYYSYSVYVPELDRGIQFSRGAYVTSDEDEIEALKSVPAYGQDFHTVGEDAEARTLEQEEEPEGVPVSGEQIRERLKEYDDMALWKPKVIEQFMAGEEVHRCEYKCGYAHYRPQALTLHQQHCPKNPDKASEENEDTSEES